MLKIKESVDLKELEKYGFKLLYGKEYWNKKITIHSNTRKIRITTWKSPYDLDVMYDLIKADLVEKVED